MRAGFSKRKILEWIGYTYKNFEVVGGRGEEEDVFSTVDELRVSLAISLKIAEKYLVVLKQSINQFGCRYYLQSASSNMRNFLFVSPLFICTQFFK